MNEILPMNILDGTSTENKIMSQHRYVFKLQQDYSFVSKTVCKQLKKDLEFRCNKSKLRMKIAADGTITVKKDYAWDGCSPKVSILDLFFVGIPDGLINIETGQHITYYASLIHDALGQFAKEQPEKMPFNRQERDLIFYEMLEGFALRMFYYIAVRLFGGIYSRFF